MNKVAGIGIDYFKSNSNLFPTGVGYFIKNINMLFGIRFFKKLLYQSGPGFNPGPRLFWVCDKYTLDIEINISMVLN